MMRGRARTLAAFARAVAGVGAAALVACGPEPLPPKPPPPPPARLTKKLDLALASLEMPGDLLLAGRWKNPSELLAQLAAWTGGAPSLEAWLRARLGEPSRPIDLTAPLELIVVLQREQEPPALGWALSVGLEPAAGAASAEPIDVESTSGLSCAESRSLGPASARMVCAPSDDQLARLLP